MLSWLHYCEKHSRYLQMLEYLLELLACKARNYSKFRIFKARNFKGSEECQFSFV